jgi:hypothetical protein
MITFCLISCIFHSTFKKLFKRKIVKFFTFFFSFKYIFLKFFKIIYKKYRPLLKINLYVYSRKESKRKKIRVQILDNWGDADDALDMLLPKNTNSWGNVFFSTKKHFFIKPDYLLVLNQPSKAVKITFNPSKIIFAIGEPPTRVHDVFHRGRIDYSTVMTCNESLAFKASDSKIKYVLGPCLTRTWSIRRSFDQLTMMDVPKKNKSLSWVTSNLTLLEGHKIRMEFLNKIQNKVPVDIFGRGFTEIYDKSIGLQDYKYSIAFENTISNYYYTEKLLDCFLMYTVPIYFGSPMIEHFFPKNSMIRFSHDDPDIINKINDVITKDDYASRLPALKEARRRVILDENIFIRLAKFIESDQNSCYMNNLNNNKLITIDTKELNWND